MFLDAQKNRLIELFRVPTTYVLVEKQEKMIFNYTPISGGLDMAFNSFIDGCDLCCLLITLADQDRQNGLSSLLHLGLHCLPNYQFTIF